MRVAVVTDSESDIGPDDVRGLDVTIVTIKPEPPAFLRREAARATGAGTAVLTSPGLDPLAATFVDAYERLADSVDAVLSIHVSGRLSGVVEAAREARAQLRGVVPIEVVDSGIASHALAFVVRRVARAARRGASLADLDLLTRRALQNVHAMFFAESVEHLNRDARWARNRTWPISGNGTRPLLHVEDGEVKPLERVRTRARGYDRLAEFVELFPHVDELAIVHDATPGDLENLMKRIEPIYPREQIVVGSYGPTLRAQVGPHAIGIFVDQGIGYD